MEETSWQRYHHLRIKCNAPTKHVVLMAERPLNSAITTCYLFNMALKGREEKDGTSILEKNHPPSRWKARIKKRYPLYKWLIQKLGEREREYSEY